ncbi:MAG: RecX family transcriptional regulator [Rhodospirillaceae bacterium]|nr:RecX family transcriptional regulator [Rhodospirillaceae bacterium]
MNKVKSKVITEESLRKSGLWYLEKYAASAHSLRQVLNRRVLKAMLVEDLDKDTCNHWIDCIIERFTKAGLLNDSEFAQAKASSLFKKGTSTQMIRSKLFDKGISGAIIDQVIADLHEDWNNPELKAAIRFSQRKRLGPFRQLHTRSEFNQRDLATMGRAGFSYEVAQKIINAINLQELENDDGY